LLLNNGNTALDEYRALSPNAHGAIRVIRVIRVIRGVCRLWRWNCNGNG